MRFSLVKRQTYFMVAASLLLLLLLTACGGSTPGSSTSPTPTATPAPNATPVVGAATATEIADLHLMTLVGQPTAKLVSGNHTFEVDGQMHNGDTKQHDVYVQAVVLDASGAIVGSSAFFNVDNIPPGQTSNFAIRGTTLTPTWASVQVKIIAVTENIGGTTGG